MKRRASRRCSSCPIDRLEELRKIRRSYYWILFVCLVAITIGICNTWVIILSPR